MDNGHNQAVGYGCEPKMQRSLKLITSTDPLARRVTYAHWFLLTFTLSFETLALVFSPLQRERVACCIGLLAVLALLSIRWPENKPLPQRVAQMVLELLLITVASSIGFSRWTWPLYLTVLARSVLLLQGRYIWRLVLTAFICQESWYVSSLMFGHSPVASSWPVNLATCIVAAFLLTGTYGAFMVIVAWLMLALLNEQRLRVETERLGDENQALATKLERSRIAREIHDTLGHSLTSLKIQLELGRRLMAVDDKRAVEAIEQAEQLAARSLTDTRVALQSVRNSDFDFEIALKQLIEEVHAGGKLVVSSKVNPVQIPNATSYQLYRVVQESITNTLKHAKAANVFIELTHDGSQVKLEIQDDGRGFDGACATDGIGLQGIRERISSLQGIVQIESELDRGTKVTAQVPL